MMPMLTPSDASIVVVVAILAAMWVLTTLIRAVRDVLMDKRKDVSTGSADESCSCGYVASIGGRDPQCPVHGQATDGAAS